MRRATLIEKLRAYLLGCVDDGANEDMRGFFGVKNVMRLEEKPAVTRRQFVRGLPDVQKGVTRVRTIASKPSMSDWRWKQRTRLGYVWTRPRL